ncbi:Protein phosphatase 1 regulatory inhibitor subunit PPP1R8 homolog [Linum perenne]
MYGRAGLERFKKAQSSEPFSVSDNSAPNTTNAQTLEPSSGSACRTIAQSQRAVTDLSVQYPRRPNVDPKPLLSEAGPLLGLAQQLTQVGGGQSTWQPPDWAIEPRSGVYCLEVMKDGEVIDRINLDKRRHIFGRQSNTCDFVLDHQSVSRQHAAVVPHKSGSIYVIDLGSAHGTFVANERLTKDAPVELEVGQSLRFAASTRAYILRKNDAALFTSFPPCTEIILPSSPDQNDEEAVVYYNTQINRYGLDKLAKVLDFRPSSHLVRKQTSQQPERSRKRMKKARVVFKDQVGGELVEVVGVSDGVDVGTEHGPAGVKEGSLIGRYESLVQSVVIPKGKEASSLKESNGSQQGVTNRLQEVLTKVKALPTQAKGLYDSLYDESLSSKLGSSWASSAVYSGGRLPSPTKGVQGKGSSGSSVHNGSKLSSYDENVDDNDDDDLFGD